MNRCQTPGCNRAPLTSSTGAVYAHCASCTGAILRDAFTSRQEPATSWHALARAHRLPPLIVGGVSA